ncbi:MAG: hypothetical protein ACKVP7_02565 [Hyphomicrobiaceae bacterium]
MLWRIVRLFLALVAGAVIITVAISNRHTVPLILDPVSEKPILFMERRLFEYLLATLIFGVILGGMATWFTQSHWRRSARHRAQEAMRWQAEADRLAREREEAFAAEQSARSPITGKALAIARR